jgi:hypothetical protein
MKPRLLANENFPALSVRHLRDRGYDVAAFAGGGGGLTDPEVLALAPAVTELRWIVTFARDYGELIFARVLAAPPVVVLSRMRSRYTGRDLGGTIQLTV